MAYFLQGSYGGDKDAKVGIVYYSKDGDSNWTTDPNRKKLYATSALAQADIDSGIVYAGEHTAPAGSNGINILSE